MGKGNSHIFVKKKTEKKFVYVTSERRSPIITT